jgi:glycosyltransferase involved in cell wall biosynthesis
MISIVVPTYNEEKNIERCLNALTNQTIPRDQIEIIVVDGDSTDRTLEIAADLADVVTIQTCEGVGGARNDGFKIAKYDIVATTDADCEPSKKWVESIIKQFEKDKVVAVTGILKPFDWQKMNGIEIMVYRILFELSNLLLLILSLLGQYHLCGANSAFTKDAFLDVGGYLPLAYADDVEIIKRIKKKGRVELSGEMQINYSVRRIKKIGLMKYFYLLLKMDIEIMLLERQPMKGDYARMEYD